MVNQERKRLRGFAAMDAAKQREIASKGGKAAHQKGTAHEFTPDEAREAGRKGGEAVSQNREHMAAIGRKGGESSHGGWDTRSRKGESYSDGASTAADKDKAVQDEHHESHRRSSNKEE